MFFRPDVMPPLPQGGHAAGNGRDRHADFLSQFRRGIPTGADQTEHVVQSLLDLQGTRIQHAVPSFKVSFIYRLLIDLSRLVFRAVEGFVGAASWCSLSSAKTERSHHDCRAPLVCAGGCDLPSLRNSGSEGLRRARSLVLALPLRRSRCSAWLCGSQSPSECFVAGVHKNSPPRRNATEAACLQAVHQSRRWIPSGGLRLPGCLHCLEGFCQRFLE